MKTTRAHFNLFKSECLYWLKELGLLHWSVFFEHEKMESRYAGIQYRINGRVATLALNTEWDGITFEKSAIPSKLRESAIHECLHLLLADLCEHANSRSYSQELMERDEERVIRTLEKHLRRA